MCIRTIGMHIPALFSSRRDAGHLAAPLSSTCSNGFHTIEPTASMMTRQGRQEGEGMPLDAHEYDAHRPSYPVAALNLLAELGALTPSAVVADVGSGTGIFTQVLLNCGHPVFGVEPSADLRAVAELRLAGHAGFTSVHGSAEDTTLDDRRVDLVTAASALHWFDAEPARTEFRRILRGQGWTAGLWNFRTTGDSPFGDDFDRLWRGVLGPPPAGGQKEIEDVVVPKFFGGAAFERYSFANPLLCNEEHLVGLAASSSHAPPRDDRAWGDIEQHMRHLHRVHQRDGLVQVPYETIMFCGRLL